MRRQVRAELDLPPDALIVLGCGTVDLRKGADLFVNVARGLLTSPQAAGLATKTWFIWVGHAADQGISRWLAHDAAILDLKDRVRFIGPRSDTAPYFLAADVFALTSREDPCPLVNFEAMESGLAVVAFEGRRRTRGRGRRRDFGSVHRRRGDDAVTLDTARRSPAPNRDGHKGQALIQSRFTWSRFADQFMNILTRTCIPPGPKFAGLGHRPQLSS